jgi:hypothetical protein
MYGNGVGIGMEVTAVMLKQIRKDQRAEVTACCVAVRGTMDRLTFVVHIVATPSLRVVASLSGFDMRGLVNLNTLYYYAFFFLHLFLFQKEKEG